MITYTWSISILITSALFFKECDANLPPSFTRDMNNLVLSENTDVGKVVFTLEGSDPENSTIKFGIRGTNLLKVDPYSGKVTVVKPLDHEINDTLNFVVTIEDEISDAPVGGNNIVEVPVTVIILDENDNVPAFKNVPYNISVNEDTPVGTIIFNRIYVTDADTVGDALEVECVDLPDSNKTCDVFEIITDESAQSVYHGSIVLKQRLRFGKQDGFKFLLKATDGSLDNSTVVTVTVLDVQDTPPIFTSPLEAEISEDAPINTLVLTVHAEDGDRGEPRTIVYELVTNPMNYFVIDFMSGQIRTVTPLDKEAVSNPEGKITMKIKAIEMINGIKGNDPLTVTEADVIITIKDVNDEPPLFNKNEYFSEISEDAQVGSILPNLNMTVHDPDTGNNSVFALILNDISHAFAVEPELVIGSSAVNIKIAENSLDYEDPNQRKFIILVIAKEVYTNPQLSSTATVTVTVTDANDNAPVFDRQSYAAIVSEMAPHGTVITKIVAKDRDSGQFGENGIVYQLMGGGSEKFLINNRTGSITVRECDKPGTSECLDYETKHEYFLSVKATDDDGKGQTTVVPLLITLSDTNDNPPKFNQPIYNVFVKEGAVKFDPDLIITAEDSDSSSHLTYSIVAGNVNDTFNIDPNLGKIRIATNKALKFNKDEDKNKILLTIEATDGKYSTNALVNITVSDVNDHAPLFDKETYSVTLYEDAEKDWNVIQVKATDMDDGLNARITYSIKKGAFNDFTIDSTTGQITVVSQLDYDRRNTYNIEVTAADQGTPSMTGTTTVTIQILNVNNKLPYFTPAIQKAEVMKDAKVDLVIYTLIAFDADVNSSEALNFAATEPITALDKYGKPVQDEIYKEFFSIDKTTGKVSVLNKLRRDVAAVINITVLVTDITAPTVQQGEGKLVITIIDINDRPPTFSPPWTPENPKYTLQIQEELPVGTILNRYTATDEDSVIAGYYIIPESKYFEINNGTGILQVKERIDYEKTNRLNFTVVVYDSGTPQLNASAYIDVTVQNINDNSPVFPVLSYNATVKENAPNGTYVITVGAKDADSDEFGRITYSLSGEYNDNFRIDEETGEISVANGNFFDHEILNETTVLVVASDNAPSNVKRSATVPVHVAILDVNDNPPKFNQSLFNVTVSETVQFNPPFPILQVFATDIDEGNYGNVNYKILSGNDKDAFLLGEDTGLLYVHRSLVGMKRIFNLEIEARDESGSGKFSDKAQIEIHVQSVNEHKPNFIVPALPNATVEITEDVVPSNYLIMTVKATDKDLGENGEVSYYLKSNGMNAEGTGELVINRKTGELRSGMILDPKIKSKYELDLVARDQGLPVAFETVRHMTVLLVNKNNEFEFSNQNDPDSYHFYVTENSPRHLFVGQVKVYNSDNNPSNVYYYLISGQEDNPFYIDKLNGKIYTNRSFDREEASEYNLIVLVNNEADFYLTAKEQEKILNNQTKTHTGNIARIKITVNDLNDNPPKFERENYYAAVNSLADVNEFVTNLTAVDADNGVNGSFVYYVKTSNLYKYGMNISSGSVIPSPFNITGNGSVYTATPLIENNQHRFIVDVVAKEKEYPEREGFTKLFVWIFEPEQLIRIILSRPVQEVLQEKNEIISELSNATKHLIIIDKIKHHMQHNSDKKGWSDMYILAVDPTSQTIVPVYDVLKIIDANYDFLKDYYAGFAIENVVPAYITEMEDSFDPALSALIALLLVLLVGTITFIVVCCCLRNWMISPSRLKKKDALINKAIIDDLNTTENPLWIEQKLKIYEEQELSMQVFNEPEQAALERRNDNDYIAEDNTYATIQHTSRRGSTHTGTLSLADELADYATLSGIPHLSDTLNRNSNLYEAAMGFQGSTFQVPRQSGDLDSCDGYHTTHRDLTVNNDGQPEYVAELI